MALVVLVGPSAAARVREQRRRRLPGGRDAGHRPGPVGVLDPELEPARVEAEGLAFEGVSVGSADEDRQTISVMVGDALEGHLTHTITSPTRVVLDQSGIYAGFGETLEIVSGGGTRALVRFHAPVLPEQLDGLAGSSNR